MSRHGSNFLPAGYSDSEDSNSDYFDEYNYSSSQKTLDIVDKKTEERRRRVFGVGHQETSELKEMIKRTEIPFSSNSSSESNLLDKVYSSLASDDVSVFKKALENVDSVDEIVLPGWNGGSLLMVVCSQVKTSFLHHLVVERHVQVGQVDPDGLTPLHALAGAQNADSQQTVDCAKILLDASSDLINRAQCQRLTPLMMACRMGNVAFVSFLLSIPKINLDAIDSSGYTALAFAAERGHGQIVRLLIDSKCNVNIVNKDGCTAADLASNSGFDNIKDLIDAVADRKSLLKSDCSRGFAYRTFSQLENILLSLDVDEESMKALRDNQVLDLNTFLVMDERDLEMAGITKVGLRKKLASAIVDMHKQPWDRSSIPIIKAQDRQRGIHVSCPDCIVMSANLAQHSRLMAATLQFLKKQIATNPELLSLGQDVGDVSVLRRQVDNLSKEMKVLNHHLKAFSVEVDKHADNNKLQPADRLERKDGKNDFGLINKYTLGFTVACILAIPVIWVSSKSLRQ